MSKRINLSDQELRIIALAVRATIKGDSYHLDSVVGTIGHEELLALLDRLGLEGTDLVTTDAKVTTGVSNPQKAKQ